MTDKQYKVIKECFLALPEETKCKCEMERLDTGEEYYLSKCQVCKTLELLDN